MITISSCNFPTIDPIERCVLSIDYQKCRCHLYEISIDNVGRVSDSVDYPLEYCENLIGFRPDNWEYVYLWIKEVWIWVKDNKRSKSRSFLKKSSNIRA